MSRLGAVDGGESALGGTTGAVDGGESALGGTTGAVDGTTGAVDGTTGAVDGTMGAVGDVSANTVVVRHTLRRRRWCGSRISVLGTAREKIPDNA